VIASAFFTGLFETTLQEGPNWFPDVDVPTNGGGSAYAKLFNPASHAMP